MKIDPARTVVIANPAAGGGRVGRRLDSLRRLVHAELGDVEFRVTERRGHASQLAQRAIWDGAEVLLSLGGDGTHSEVVAGMFKGTNAQPHVAIGLLPMGSGGDFRRLLDSSNNLRQHLHLIKTREPHRVDVGIAHYVDDEGIERNRIFLNECSLGMSTSVCEALNAGGKRLGAASYLTASLRAQFSHRAPLVRIRVDGQEVGEWYANTVMISNGQYAGGGMHFAPRARLSDGMLDVTVIQQTNPVRMTMLAPRLYLGRATDHKLVSSFRGFEVGIEVLTNGNASVEADGDRLGSTLLRAHVIPTGIHLLGLREDAL